MSQEEKEIRKKIKHLFLLATFGKINDDMATDLIIELFNKNKKI